MMIKDKKLLIDLKNQVITNLKARGKLRPFVILKGQRPAQNNCNGWCVSIAQVRGYNCYAELWLDHFTSHTERKLQYCIRTDKNSEKFRELVKIASKKFGRSYNIKLKDTQNEDSFTLAKSLSKNRFGKPIYEDYTPEKEQFYGMYEFNSDGLSKNRKERLVNRATEFFLDVIESLNNQLYSTELDYPQIENRLIVRQHLARERRSHLAEFRKQKDDYICYICECDFSKKYGILGSRFAEAHHIVPLSTNNKKRETRIEDLITVCANCHRMLHRMRGKKDDITRLKQIVNRNKKYR